MSATKPRASKAPAKPRATAKPRTAAAPAQPAEPAELRALREEHRRAEARLRAEMAAWDAQSVWLDRWADADGFGGTGYTGYSTPYLTRAQDATRAPLPYLPEQEWFAQLTLARELIDRNHLAIGFRDHVARFVGPVAVSFARRGAPAARAGADTADADPLVAAATAAWEEWCEACDWGQGEHDREYECLTRLITEGECTLEFFRGARNEVPQARHVEPELIRAPLTEPQGVPGCEWAERDHWSYGILSRPHDAESALALWVSDPDGTDGRVVPANRFVRAKANVDRAVKRGMSDFFPVAAEVRKVSAIQEALAHVAGVLAKIAWWEQYATATESQVRAMVEAGRDYQLPRTGAGAAGGRSESARDYRPGSVIRTEQGRQIVPPPAATNTAGFVALDEAILKSVAFRWGLPGSFTPGGGGDSFAGALVTGAPFVRLIEGRQNKQCGFTRAVALRVLELCEESGRLERGTARALKIVTTARPVVIADEEKQARTALSLFQAGLADPYEIIRERGGDPARTLANIAAHKKALAEAEQQAQPQQPAPGDAPPNPPPAPPGGPPGGPSSGPPPTDPTPAPPGSAGGDGSSPAPTSAGGLFGESRPTKWVLREGKAVREERRDGEKWQGASGRWFVMKGGRAVPTEAPQQAAPNAKQGTASAPAAEVSARDRADLSSAVDATLAERLPAGTEPPAGLAEKAKNLALDVLNKAYYWAGSVAYSKTAALLSEVAGAVFDTPQDLEKLGYNPTASSGMDAKGVDPVKDATGLSGHLVASIASKVIVKTAAALRDRFRSASEALDPNEREAALAAWAELVAQLLAYLSGELGATADVPGAETVRAALGRALDAHRAGAAESAPGTPREALVIEGVRYAEWWTEAEYALLSEADRSDLVKKVITDKHGRQVTRWVRPDTARGADRHAADAGTPDEHPVAAALRDPAALTAERAREVLQQVRGLKREQLRRLALTVRQKIGGKRAQIADRLVEYVKARRAAGQPVLPEAPTSAPAAPAPSRAPTVPPPSAAARAPQNVQLSMPDDARRTAEALFGRLAAPLRLAAAANAGDGASVSVRASRYTPGAVETATNGDGYVANRTLFRTTAGELRAHNDFFRVWKVRNPDYDPAAPDGDPRSKEWVQKNPAINGAELLANQVRALRELGVTTIETHAARFDHPDPNREMVGYYVWPRLGYDEGLPAETYAALPDPLKALVDANPAGSPKPRSVLGLMTTKEGRDWWKANGHSLRNMEFDTRDDSPSMRAFAKYLQDERN